MPTNSSEATPVEGTSVGERGSSGFVKPLSKPLLTIPDFYPSMIKVNTEDSVVYLMGLVHREEGTIAIKITKLQPSVKEIVTIFEYLD